MVEPNSRQSSLKFTWSQLKFDPMSRGSQAEARIRSIFEEVDIWMEVDYGVESGVGCGSQFYGLLI